MNLSTFDLNLLKTLLVLLQEKNTNRAAERLGTSQPAVSRTLAKLRRELNDPLFTRHSRGLILTPRAEQIAIELPEIMNSLELALQNIRFDPSKQSGKLSFALNGFLIESHGFQIYQALQKEAPGLQLDLHSYSPMTVSQLISGDIDAAINYFPLDISKELRQLPVGNITMGLICRAGHPLANQRIDRSTLFANDLVGLIIPDHNIRELIAKKYAEAGVEVRTRFRSQQLNPILNVVETSDALFVAPTELLNSLGQNRFACVQVNIDHKIMEQKLGFIYNTRHSSSPKFQWLENLIKRVLS